jgi:NitT/TauT family transport system substrate-binding protein
MRRNLGGGLACVLAIASMGLLAACGGDDDATSTSASGGTSAEQPIKLSVGYVPVADEAILKLPIAQDTFKKHGIDLEFGKAAPTGAGQTAQLLNGQLDVGIGALTGVMAGVSQNIPVVTISAMTHDFEKGDQTAYATIARKGSGIESFKDLEGKTVAVNSLQGVWEIITREAVAKDGGDPKKVKLVVVPFADQVTALKSGRVDAITSAQPFIASLVAEGNKRLGDPQALASGDKESVATVAMMSKALVQKEPDAPTRWVAALTELADYANAHPDEVRKAIIAETKSPADVVNNAPVPAYSPAIPRSNVETFNDLMVKYGAQKKPVTADQVLWDAVPSS